MRDRDGAGTPASGVNGGAGAITAPMAKPSSGQSNRQQLLERAIGAHQQGRLGEAERLYSEILAAEPEHFDAQHLLEQIYNT